MTRLRLALAAVLFLAVVFAFRSALACGFINFDDPAYVQSNPILHGGLSFDGVERAFTTVHGGYWIPLTWISYQADYHFSGLNPGGYHRTNVLLHAVTGALLFLTLCRMTNAVGRSFTVAALFALHPVQVESVAWVTERKDVLSTFFFVLAILAYARYAERPGAGRYLAVVLAFVLGLLSKPMVVTLPVVLLLLDLWPLQRRNLGAKRLLMEKLPLFTLALAAGLLTILTQKQGTAVRSIEEFSLYARLSNAIVGYVIYLRMFLWPHPLAVFYPHPGGALPVWQVAAALVLLLAVTWGCWKRVSSRPELLIGWLWYVVTLAPVSGVLQAGWQGQADRFLYVPSIGLFVCAVWTIADVLAPRVRWVFAGIVLSACAAGTVLQLRHWRDSLTIWEHTFAVTEDNFVCRASLAAALLDEGRPEEAVKHLERAIELKPSHELAYYLLGVAAQQQQRFEESERRLRQALERSGDYVEALAVLAEVLVELKRFREAEEIAMRARKTDPHSAAAAASLAAVRFHQGSGEEGLRLLREALALDPHAEPLRRRLAEESQRHKNADK